jgi:hypothetical protein
MSVAANPFPFIYRFHGVVVASHYDLPDLPAVSAEDPEAQRPRITIFPGSQDLLRALPVSEYDIVVHEHDVLEFLIPEGAVIRLTPGGTVEVAMTSTVPGDLVRHVIIGQVLPNALVDLGMVCLHASAVQMGTVAMALLGEGGIGKSSLAAAFLASGFPVLCDDCTPLVQQGHASYVLPGPGRLKLWPDTVEALGLQRRVRRPIYAGHVKLVVDAGTPVATPVPFGGLMILREGPEFQSEQVTDGNTVIPLLYQNIFGHRRLSRAAKEAHFAATTKLALTTPMTVTTIPRDLSRLREMVRYFTL